MATWFRRPCGALLVTGLSIGWLVGLSKAPVINAILTGLLAIVAGIMAVKPDHSAEDVERRGMVLSILVLGVAIGVIPGNLVRNFDFLGPAGLTYLFASSTPREVPSAPSPPKDTSSEKRSTGLNAILAKDCPQLKYILSQPGPAMADSLRKAFRTSTTDVLVELGNSLDAPELHLVAQALCR